MFPFLHKLVYGNEPLPLIPARSPGLLPLQVDGGDDGRWKQLKAGGNRGLYSFLVHHEVLHMARQRAAILKGPAWPMPQPPDRLDTQYDVIRTLDAFVELLQKQQKTIAPMLRVWLQGGGVFQVKGKGLERDFISPGIEMDDGPYVLESRINHHVFNHNATDFLVTLPGEFVVAHGVKGLRVADSGLKEDFSLTLGPTASGRYAPYVLVSGVTHTGYFTCRRGKITGEEDGVLSFQAFQKSTLLLTQWRRAPEVQRQPAPP